MKIIDVKVTVWKWDNIPPTQYTKDFKSLDSRSTNMALVQILTDENITGYAFMGHSMATQSYNAPVKASGRSSPHRTMYQSCA